MLPGNDGAIRLYEREGYRRTWLRSVRRVLTETPDERFGYLDGRGAIELRSALAAYLNRVRGTNATSETVIITNGYAQAGPAMPPPVRSGTR